MEDAKAKSERYISITEQALKEIEILVEGDMKPVAERLIDMASRYLEDAKYFYGRGDYLTALAAASYAHAWLDAGVILGLLKGENPKIFMVEP